MFIHAQQAEPSSIIIIAPLDATIDSLVRELKALDHKVYHFVHLQFALDIVQTIEPDVILTVSATDANTRSLMSNALMSSLPPLEIPILNLYQWAFDMDTSLLSPQIQTNYIQEILLKTQAYRHIRELQKIVIAIAQSVHHPLILINEGGLVLFCNDQIDQFFDKINVPQGFMDHLIAKLNIDLQHLPDHFSRPLHLTDFSNAPFTAIFKRLSIGGRAYFSIEIIAVNSNQKNQTHFKDYTFYDSLTKLPNRILLKERLNTEIIRTKRSHTQLGVLFIDLDNFKHVNDALGHDLGDKLLIEVANRIVKTLRADDFVARLGGDEFLVLAPGLTKGEYVGKIADNLLKALKEPISIDKHRISVSGSIGIALSPDDGTTEAALITNAEIAMYRAKEQERGTFQSFTQELSDRANLRMALENDLRLAIERDEFVVYYQPKVNTITESVIGMEALVRWLHPKKGLIPPNSFIPLAEETGLIIPIGKKVLFQACKDNKALQNEGFSPMIVSVNLSMRQFERQDVIGIVNEALQVTQLDPQWLELEITESIAMQSVNNTLTVIKTLQELGIKFSIDDFGTGYSSLSQLGKLSVDKLKIDKSFISNIKDTDFDAVIASTIMTLGKNLNMQIVAEGVETLEQVAFLRESNCDELQGYYYGKPMTIQAFKDWIRSFDPSAAP